MKLFQGIRDLLDDNESFVCVLIDEVESLTAARQSAMSGNDPSDAIRVCCVIDELAASLAHVLTLSSC